MLTTITRRLMCRTLAGLVCLSLSMTAATISVDQFGDGSVNGQPLPSSLTNDPGPGGEDGVLTYALPFAATQGDVALLDPNFDSIPLEIIRFNGDGTLIFYAGNDPASLAYVSAPPSADYANIALASDTGPEASNYAVYTPTIGQPGYDPSLPTYEFLNGTASPEPGTAGLLSATLLGLFGYLRLRKRKADAMGRANPPSH